MSPLQVLPFQDQPIRASCTIRVANCTWGWGQGKKSPAPTWKLVFRPGQRKGAPPLRPSRQHTCCRAAGALTRLSESGLEFPGKGQGLYGSQWCEDASLDLQPLGAGWGVGLWLTPKCTPVNFAPRQLSNSPHHSYGTDNSHANEQIEEGKTQLKKQLEL